MTTPSAGPQLTSGVRQPVHDGATREQGLVPLGQFNACGGREAVTPKQTRLFHDLASEARWGLNYLHGEGRRSRAFRSGRFSQQKAEQLQSCTR